MAAVSVSADGHFNIPDGTTTIVSRPEWEEEGEDSWEEWGVDKQGVKTVTISSSVTAIGAVSYTHLTLPTILRV